MSPLGSAGNNTYLPTVSLYLVFCPFPQWLPMPMQKLFIHYALCASMCLLKSLTDLRLEDNCSHFLHKTNYCLPLAPKSLLLQGTSYLQKSNASVCSPSRLLYLLLHLVGMKELNRTICYTPGPPKILLRTLLPRSMFWKVLYLREYPIKGRELSVPS